MSIRKVKLEEVFPPKPPKTKSEAVYVDDEPEPETEKVKVSRIHGWKGKLAQERLKGLDVGDVVYFPEFARSDIRRCDHRTKQASKLDETNYRHAITRSADALGLSVSVYWVRARNSTVIPRATITAKKSEGS
jgi:hypothetical protein